MRKLSSILNGLGYLLLIAALALTVYNIQDDNRAKAASSEVLEMLSPSAPDVTVIEGNEELILELPMDQMEITDSEILIPDYELDPNMKMPVQTVNGQDYIGILTFEELSLELPVMSDWDYPKLKEAPCRYHGSAYQDNLVIMAHNFQSHFGQISNLSTGSIITFKDMDDNLFTYQVLQTELLAPTEVDTVNSGMWDLTLFTCTTGGQYRIAVRCERQ